MNNTYSLFSFGIQPVSLKKSNPLSKNKYLMAFNPTASSKRINIK